MVSDTKMDHLTKSYVIMWSLFLLDNEVLISGKIECLISKLVIGTIIWIKHLQVIIPKYSWVLFKSNKRH